MQVSNSQPLAAIIVPVYRVEKLLPRCLDSILAQTWPNWVAVLVDDQTPDGSGAVCDEYAARDPRFLVVHRPVNGGLSACRNSGLDAMPENADFVFFVDSDDAISPVALELGLRLAVQYPGEICSWGYTDAADSLVRALPEQPLPVVRHYAADRLLEYYLDWSLIPMWNKVFPAALFSRDGLRFDPDVRYAEDRVFMLACLDHCLSRDPGSTVHHLPLPLYWYDTVSNTGSLSHTVGLLFCRHHHFLLPLTIDFFRRHGYDDLRLAPVYLEYMHGFMMGLERLISRTPGGQGEEPLPEDRRKQLLREALRHPELKKLLEYFPATGVYTPYYLLLKLHCRRFAVWLYRSQCTGQKFWYWKFYWLGRYAWGLFHRIPDTDAGQQAL